MKKTSYRVSNEIKEQILKRVKEDGVPVTKAAEEHGIKPNTIYGWLSKGVTKPVSWLEFNKLKKENQELKELIGEITIELSKTKKKS